MNNYEYIIAGLPDIGSDYRGPLDCEGILEDIRRELCVRDRAFLDTLLSGFEPENMTPEFYEAALKSGNRFIREYFSFDLDLRNCRVEYLNRAIGRPDGQDVMVLPGKEEPREFELRPAVDAVLEGSDLLERERGIDGIVWDHIEELTVLEVFTLDSILAFVAKMQIVARWLKLDPDTGRELFVKLANEIRNNKKAIA